MKPSCIGNFYKIDIPIQKRGRAYSYRIALTLDTKGKYRATQTSLQPIISYKIRISTTTSLLWFSNLPNNSQNSEKSLLLVVYYKQCSLVTVNWKKYREQECFHALHHFAHPFNTLGFSTRSLPKPICHRGVFNSSFLTGQCGDILCPPKYCEP